MREGSKRGYPVNDTTLMLSAIGAVMAFVVPTIWHLATRIEKLSGVIETSAEGTRQRLSNIESRLVEVSDEIKDNRQDKQALTERITVLETKMSV